MLQVLKLQYKFASKLIPFTTTSVGNNKGYNNKPTRDW